MKKIGVRQLKNEATQIVREVREERAEYVITVNGEPVAVLKPYDSVETEDERLARVSVWLAEAAEIRKELTATWPAGLSAADAVAEQRREL